MVRIKKLLGCMIFDSTGLAVVSFPREKDYSSSQDDSDLVPKCLLGSSLTVPRFVLYHKNKNGDPLLHNKGEWEMVLLAPILGTDEDILGCLEFRVDPSTGFHRILESARFGVSGEAYAFIPPDGTMISESRFMEDLKKVNLVKQDFDTAVGLSQIVLKDPGGNLLEGYTPTVSREDQPLTLSVSSAFQGGSGMNLEGYRDYRGVTVVGAWKWLEQQEFGIALEMDIVEARRALSLLGRAYTVIVFLLFVLGLVSAGYHLKEQATSSNLKKTVALLKSSRELFRCSSRIAKVGGFHIHPISFRMTYTEELLQIHKGSLTKSSHKHNPGPDQMTIDEFCSIYSPPYHDYLKNAIEKGVTKGTPWDLELMTQDGKWIRSIGSPLLSGENVSGQKTVVDIVGMVQDVTEAKRDAGELLKAKESAETAVEIKSQFLANMSHEIRTPMNGVLSMCRLLVSTPLSEEQKEIGDVLYSSGETLLKVINQILDFSKIERGCITPEKSSFSPKKLHNHISKLYQGVCEEKGIHLSLSFDDSIPEYVVGDSLRLRQVLVNLLDNATKFTHKGYVEITASLLSKQPGILEIKHSVRDTGIGISSKDQGRVFQSFNQADPSITKLYGGTGLGLSICQSICKMMGSTLHCESEIGVGSTFWFSVQYEVFQKETKPPDTTSPRSLKGRIEKNFQARILVVEDNRVNQIVAKKVLSKLGYTNIELASHGKEGLEKHLNQPADLIFMDCSMPIMDGFEATRLIRVEEKSLPFRTPIIALTAYVLSDTITQCFECGMDAHLGKPIVLEQLEHVLDKWLPSCNSKSQANCSHK